MEKLKRSLSFRKKKEHVPECSKPHQWQEDERKVREGTCSFQVRYLGCIEVFESRGMQICEEAVKALKAVTRLGHEHVTRILDICAVKSVKQSRSVWSRLSFRRKKKKDKQQCKGKYQRAILYVSGDALRVVDEISKGLIVDQTIEKVSFCAPDRNHEKGFAYICRDGTTRRWMCHGFLALKESGERLSHAVGCAFAICLEKKQKREKEAVSVQFNDKGTSFTRTGSFRQTTITERLADPQSALVAEPLPVRAVDNPFAVQRPHATAGMLQRQGSFRGFSKLNESSPFKRQLSVRLNELPSTLERAQELNNPKNGIANGPQPSVSPIAEASPTKENAETITEMCQALTQGLSALTSEDPFTGAKARGAAPPGAPAANQQTVRATTHRVPAAEGAPPRGYSVTVQGRNITLPEPIQQGNPWAPPPPVATGRKVSDADFWLNATASQVAVQREPYPSQGIANGTSASPVPPGYTPAPGAGGQIQMTQPVVANRAPQLAQRSHSIDTSEMYAWTQQQQRAPTLRELANRGPVQQFQSQQNGTVAPKVATSASGQPWSSLTTAPRPPLQADPFDAAWAAKAANLPQTNPFQPADTVTKSFEVNL